ncbi:MAG: ATP-binding cassette domain-containing protein, partial [Planctomycetes bacterium]|nr:ATP-binding cassette domain-containing protein [Planctomycetota bacterium]
MSQKNDIILDVRGLSKTYISQSRLFQKNEEVHAVKEISFTIQEGEVLGIVGESGCGKSTTARMIAGLHQASSGTISYQNQALLGLHPEIQMIFQDPYNSLNPRMTMAEIISEPLINFGICKRKEALYKSMELMENVGLDISMLYRYPHEFSGGQRQRIGIARALAPQPKLLICDEPVSALDVSVQAQILNLLENLKEDLHLTILFISHDLSVIRHISDRVLVMNQGEIVESGDVDEVGLDVGYKVAKLLEKAYGERMKV